MKKIMAEIRIPETAYVAMDLDNFDPEEYGIIAERRVRSGKGWSRMLTLSEQGLNRLRQDAKDRAYHFDADPSHWATACRKVLDRINRLQERKK